VWLGDFEVAALAAAELEEHAGDSIF